MRQVKRLGRSGRVAPRRRPPPRLWLRRLGRGAVVVLAALLIAGGAYGFLRSATAARLAEDLRQRAIAASVASGANG